MWVRPGVVDLHIHHKIHFLNVFILNVSSRPKMHERAPAITSAFQMSGTRISERKKGLSLHFKDVLKRSV